MFRSTVLLCIGLLIRTAAGQLFEGSCYLFYKNTSVELKQPITVAFQSRSPDTCLKLCNLANQANAVLTCKSIVFDDKQKTCSMYDSYGPEAGGKKVAKPGSDYYEFWPNCQERLGQQLSDSQLQLLGSNNIDSNLAVQKFAGAKDFQRLAIQSAPSSQPNAPGGSSGGGYGGQQQSSGGYGGQQQSSGGYGGQQQSSGGYGGQQQSSGGYGGSSGGGAPSSQPQAPGGSSGGSYGAQPSSGYGAQPSSGYGGSSGGGAPSSQPQAPGGSSGGGYGAQPSSGYGAQPSSGYGAQPSSGYGAQPSSGYGAQPSSSYGAQPSSGYGGGGYAQPPAYTPQTGGGYASTGGASCVGGKPTKKKTVGESIQEIKKGDTGADTLDNCAAACCKNSATKSVDFYKGDDIPCVCNGKKCDDKDDPAVCVDDDAGQHLE